MNPAPSPRIQINPEATPIAKSNIVALLLCACALMIDGFDLFLVGNLAAAIAPSFHVHAAKLSQVFLFQQAGLAVGAFTISPISDRIGRKKVLLACASAFGLLTLAALFARSLLVFAILRGLAGIFLSGLIPNALALLIEVTPRRRQGLFVSIAFTGYAAGSTGGALVGALLLNRFGWHSGFWIGGIVPLLYVALAAWAVPTPPVLHPGRRATDPSNRAGATIKAPSLALSISTHAGPPTSTWRDIFRDGWAPCTAILWGIFFLTSGALALVFAWMPAFFETRGGISIQAYSAVASFSLIGAMAGTLSIGYVLDRFGSTPVLVGTFLLAVAAMETLGHARFGTKLFIASLMALSLFQGSGQTALSAVVAQFYPTSMRATGVGWAFGAGRIGGIAGPWAGGLMLAAGFTVPQFFIALALPLILTAVLVIILQRADAVRRAQTPRSGQMAHISQGPDA